MSSGCQSTERTKADQSRTLWAHPVRHQPQATALVPCSCCHFSLSPTSILVEACCCFLEGRALRQCPYSLIKWLLPTPTPRRDPENKSQKFYKRAREWEQMVETSIVTAPCHLSLPHFYSIETTQEDLRQEGPLSILLHPLSGTPMGALDSVSVTAPGAVGDTTPAP